MKGGALWIACKSLRQHVLSTWIAAGSIALAGGLLMMVWILRAEAEKTFANSTGGFDAVLGARGSQLQLVLNSIFHLEASPGRIPGDSAITAKNLLIRNRHPLIRSRAKDFENAIPIAVGDNYKGFRIVGTVRELFEEHNFAQGRKFALVGSGTLWQTGKETLRGAIDESEQADEPEAPPEETSPDLEDGKEEPSFSKQAVVGSFASKKLGLKEGDTFQPYHGLSYVGGQEPHADLYTVVGILKSTGTPADRVIWIPIEGFQAIAGHENFQKDISALLLKHEGGDAALRILATYFNNYRDDFTFAPITPVLSAFFKKFGWFQKILELVAYLVALVAAGSILAILYNSMNEKRREIAILRSLGARRWTLISMVVFQSMGIALLGVALSFVFYAAVASVAAAIIREQTGVILDLFAFQEVFLWVPLGMLALGLVSGMIPAIVAYQTEVSRNLAPTS